MSFVPWHMRSAKRLRTLGESTPLLRAERLTLLGLASAGVVVSLVFVIVSDPVDFASSAFQLLLTACFACFVWSPLVAATAILAAMAASFSVGDETSALVAVAVAVGCVVRTGSRLLISSFVGGFLVAGAAAVTYAEPRIALSSLAATLLLATVSGAIGLLLTIVSNREKRLEKRLQAQEKGEQEATLAERQRIADELHDVIAHDLTIIAMYSRVLVQPIDDDLRAQSQQTIREAAHKALDDLRRVVEQAKGPAVIVEAPTVSLTEALEHARSALQGVGDTLDVAGNPEGIQVPRVLDHALARILRESVTNVLKHGGRGTVEVAISRTTDSISMSVVNPLDATRRPTELPSGGYGLVRMTARARELGGQFSAGFSSGTWLVTVSFPLS